MAPQSSLIADTLKIADQHQLDISEQLLRTYLDLSGPEYVDSLTPEIFYSLVASHKELSAGRDKGEIRVKVTTDEDRNRTIIQAVNDDMPFLVDSAEGGLRVDSRRILSVTHPIIDGPHGPESWMTLEIANASGHEAEIEQRLTDVFKNVTHAVSDWQNMLTQVREAASATDGETSEFLSWLAAGHFTILGYVEHGKNADDTRRYGVVRDDDLLPAIEPETGSTETLQITKSPWRSTVHRAVYADLIIVRTEGKEYRFLGLFTSTAYQWSVSEVPVLRETAKNVVKANKVSPESHAGRDLMEILESYPRDLLFVADADQVADNARTLLLIRDRRETKIFVTPDPARLFLSVYVVTPRDQYNTKVRVGIENILRETYQAGDVEYSTMVTEANQASLSYVLRGPRLNFDVDQNEVEDLIRDVVRNWDEDFEDELSPSLPGPVLDAARSHSLSIPEGYKARFSPVEAAHDLSIIANLEKSVLQVYERDQADTKRLKLYTKNKPALSDILPIFTFHGIRVTDERPFEITGPGVDAHIVDFGIQRADKKPWDESTNDVVSEALLAAIDGRTESDPFSGLVLSAGLTWEQVAIIRALAAYMKQGGAAFALTTIASTLIEHPELARQLAELFETKFKADGFEPSEKQREKVVELSDALNESLDTLASLDQERIVTWLLLIINAMVRTNVYTEHRAMAFKLDPRAIPMLPEPRPLWEIFVYSTRLEGVHLRYGMVARGGLRWSDRRDDFRTEVLGLVKAQAVKNAVIVPAGAKGGFYAKQLPDASDREAFLAEGQGAYEDFVASLLSITDNLVDGEPVSPVLRWDGPDTYLVVAADKGTAKFSDVANGVAQEADFWLDDAFASGGSAGYDHKAMGITARGAWEAVKSHFRQLGIDCQNEDFTAVGVGDMSGDVFGNGMLLSKHTRLVGAFDHRHVFVDPNPVAATSYPERKRLFDLPRSSWADYDTSLISEGGGVWPRTAKHIPVSSQMREALGLDDDVTSMTPDELIHAILAAPVDLLFNGGIGTYVKGSAESHVDVGDKANDSIRVNGNQVRAKIIGEGGNLGATQLGRIEAAHNGVLVNTDAIDNSGGVDSSDHEVNIKIHLSHLVTTGVMTLEERNALLGEMTDAIATSVLANNYAQNVLLANARSQSALMLPVHRRHMAWLENHADLKRELEFLPTDGELDERAGRSEGLTSPEFSVLVAYTKLALKADLLNGDLIDDPWCEKFLIGYVPEQMRTGVASQGLTEHPLRREIIANIIANLVVNRGGITFLFRAMEETGATSSEVTRAFLVAEQIFDMTYFVTQVSLLDGKIPAATQSRLYIRFRKVLDRAVRWLINTRTDMSDIPGTVARFHDHVTEWVDRIGEVLVGSDLERHEAAIEALVDSGLDEGFATWAQGIFDTYSVLDVVVLSETTGQDVETVFTRYSLVGEQFRFDELLAKVDGLPATNFWETMAKSAIRSDVYATLAAMTKDSLEYTTMDEWMDTINTSTVDEMLTLLFSQDSTDLAPLTVALRSLRSLIGA